MTDWETKAQEYVDKHAPKEPHYIRQIARAAYLSGAADNAREAVDAFEALNKPPSRPAMVFEESA